ncbi:MAG: hypothetical protein GAK33_00968 [Burkholderia lata]|uniref:DUF6708 domain-containing protein n=1 Tax=Burkholderia lata (strain ATCC 17760 / DSM 23089 / LMG 22485 / NCIMB 9086 / R18194 / 383) TaxID=482957 RepID=A0A833PX05_BURL3|nr:hypothetical protein [Burkholderia lata]KAF1039968.1 MAG: hypothetical protein GAK33_00968 [Burkholderia lata]
MSDDASAKAYWSQLFSKRYWREVVIGLPPKDPWAPTVDMLAYRLDKTRPTSIKGEPVSLEMVVARNETYMEVADGSYMRRGFGGMAYTLMALPIIFSSYFISIYTILNIRAIDNLMEVIFVSIFSIVIGTPLVLLIGYHWKQDMWDYTYKPIRLVRSTRKVHVFQHNGPDGVWSLDWDNLVFCLKKGGLNWGVLGYLPDANGQVTHAFYLGAVMPVHPKGIGPDEPLLAHWEYIRRYMEAGPESVPVPDLLLPIENRREPFLYGVYRLWQMFGPFAVLFAPVTTLAGLFRWLAMRMSSLPCWPAEVEAQCQVSPDDATVQPRKKATDNSVGVAMGVVVMLALDVVLFWLLFTRVFEIDRLFT